MGNHNVPWPLLRCSRCTMIVEFASVSGLQEAQAPTVTQCANSKHSSNLLADIQLLKGQHSQPIGDASMASNRSMDILLSSPAASEQLCPPDRSKPPARQVKQTGGEPLLLQHQPGTRAGVSQPGPKPPKALPSRELSPHLQQSSCQAGPGTKCRGSKHSAVKQNSEGNAGKGTESQRAAGHAVELEEKAKEQACSLQKVPHSAKTGTGKATRAAVTATPAKLCAQSKAASRGARQGMAKASAQADAPLEAAEQPDAEFAGRLAAQQLPQQLAVTLAQPVGRLEKEADAGRSGMQQSAEASGSAQGADLDPNASTLTFIACSAIKLAIT